MLPLFGCSDAHQLPLLRIDQRYELRPRYNGSIRPILREYQNRSDACIAQEHQKWRAVNIDARAACLDPLTTTPLWLFLVLAYRLPSFHTITGPAPCWTSSSKPSKRRYSNVWSVVGIARRFN